MSTPSFQRSLTAKAAAFASALILSACGGGSGGDDPPATATPSRVTLGGVVSKGLTGNALVRVLAIKPSDGTPDEVNVLATGETNPSGAYTTTAFTVPAIYVVEVRAKDCADTTVGTGCSFHQDEATNARQYLPTGFKMRAVVTSTPSTQQVNVTPLSEIAVAAAASTSGGLTTTNANQAMAMVNTLVGVADLNTVVPTTLGTAGASNDQIRLAALLAAVSGVASNTAALSGVGCSAQTQGTPAATKCVVEALAANATVTNYSGGNVAVTTALATQLDAAVVSHPEASALVVSTKAKLIDDEARPPLPAVATGIGKARAFFEDLTSTVRTLLNSGSAPGQGAFLDQAHRFENSVAGVNFQSETTVNSVELLYTAARLWTEYEHGGTATSAVIHKALSSPDWFPESGIKCTLQKANGQDVVPGESPSLVTSTACYADYTLDMVPGSQTGSFPLVSADYANAYHWFVVTKGNTAGVFNYVARAEFSNLSATYNYQAGELDSITYDSATCPQSSNGSCTGVREFIGTVTTTLDSASRLASIHIVGDVPDGWKDDSTLAHGSGSTNLARSRLDVTASLTGTYVDGTLASNLQSGTLVLSGGNIAYAANGSTEESRLTFGSGSQVAIASDLFQNGTLNLTLATPTSKLVGTLTGQRAANYGGTVTFTGALYNLDQSETVPFISASLETSVTSSSSYNPELAYSATNYQDGTVRLDAYLTAPSHPKLRLIVAAAGRQTSRDLVWGTKVQDTASGNYIIYNVDGSTRRDVSFVVSYPSLNGRGRVAFSDGANGITFTVVDGVNESNVLASGTTVGVLNTQNNLLTFSDRSFVSLDFGTVLYSD